MIFELENGKDFIEILKQLKDIFTEVKFIVDNDDGIKTGMMDPSHTMFLSMNLPKGAFKRFEFNEDVNEYGFGVDLAKISKIKTSGDDQLTVDLTDEEICFNLKSKKTSKKYKFNNLVIENDVKQVPPIQYNNEILIKASTLLEYISSFPDITDIVEIIFDDKIKISGKEGISELEIEIETDDNHTILNYKKESESVKARFRVEYLVKILKTLKISDYIILKLNDGAPIRLDANIFGEGEIIFFLAPLAD